MTTTTLEERRSSFRTSDAERSAATAALLARAHASDDETVRRECHDDVVRLNMRVAEALARRFARRSVPLEDLTQIAYLALVRAVRGFDPSHDRDLLAYAVPTIEGDIRRHFRDHGWTIRPPRDVQRAHTRLVRTGASLDRYDGPHAGGARPPGRGVGRGGARGAHRPLLLHPALAGPAGLDRGGGRPDHRRGRRGDRTQEQSEARLLLQPLVATLGRREQQMLQWRFVDELSQREIAERLDLSQVQVSRLLQRVLTRMRGALVEAC